MKFNELGRSMVEMLGVLAIIGVLSVGALSGYSKAMMKYKLNKQREQLTTLISGMKQVFTREIFTNDNVSGDTYYLKQLLMKLNIIPTEMIKTESGDYGVQDIMGYDINLYWVKSSEAYKDGKKVDGFFGFSVSNNTVIDKDSCMNIFDMAKQMHADLWKLTTNGTTVTTYYGDVECGTSDTKPCLRDLTVSEINQICYDGSNSSRFFINLHWV